MSGRRAVGGVLVVVPVHDEVRLLPRCLHALRQAARHVPVPVRIQVVLDDCTDGSERVIGPDIEVLTSAAHNVGMARARGFARAGTDCGFETWFATTDADSEVDPGWLRNQLRHARNGVDLVAGTVRVEDWHGYSPTVRRRYEQRYRRRSNGGHGHVHGANLGFRADLYWRAGGFRPLPTGEDVDFVRRAIACGAHLVWAEDVTVRTSARTHGRAPDGFAAHLRSLDPRVAEVDGA